MLPKDPTKIEDYKRKISESQKKIVGVARHNYKYGRRTNHFYCNCGNEITSTCYFYGSGKCIPCVRKKQLETFNHLLLIDRTGKKNGMFGIKRFGKNNPNYKENKKNKDYPLEWNKTFKEEIRYRDNYICQNCNIRQNELKRKLHVHHIDYDKNNLNINNLISLCGNCHAKTTVSKPEKILYWVNYYKEKMLCLQV